MPNDFCEGRSRDYRINRKFSDGLSQTAFHIGFSAGLSLFGLFFAIFW